MALGTWVGGLLLWALTTNILGTWLLLSSSPFSSSEQQAGRQGLLVLHFLNWPQMLERSASTMGSIAALKPMVSETLPLKALQQPGTLQAT
jgi:hypothetical protein